MGNPTPGANTLGAELFDVVCFGVVFVSIIVAFVMLSASL